MINSRRRIVLMSVILLQPNRNTRSCPFVAIGAEELLSAARLSSCEGPRESPWHLPARPWGGILSKSPRPRPGLGSKGPSLERNARARARGPRWRQLIVLSSSSPSVVPRRMCFAVSIAGSPSTTINRSGHRSSGARVERRACFFLRESPPALELGRRLSGHFRN